VLPLKENLLLLYDKILRKTAINVYFLIISSQTTPAIIMQIRTKYKIMMSSPAAEENVSSSILHQ